MKNVFNFKFANIFIVLLFGLSLSVAYGQTLIINEVSQGPSGSKEYVEFLVIPTGAINPCQPIANCLDMRGWIFDDNNGIFTPGSTSGVGLAQGALRFSNSAFWSCIPIGTLIVVYNDQDINASLPANDFSMNDGNCRLILPASSGLIEGNANNPSAAAPLTYTMGGWVPGGSWAYTGMSNTNDSYQIYAPFATNIPAHSVSWGNNTSNTIIYFAAAATATVHYFNSLSNNPFLQNNWSSGSSPLFETPGAGNNAANTAYIQSLTNNCTPITPLAANPSSQNATCGCTGSASAAPTGGNGTFAYAWTDAQGQAIGASSSISNLCSGWYYVQITSGACTTTDSVNIQGGGVAVNPTFAAMGPYCQGAQAGALPNTSTNGITGTWSPANISTANAGNTQYTFTPNAGQCANPFNQTITVNVATNPTFAAVGPYCQGAQAGALPNTSTNGIIGTWSPANISTANAGNVQYTFTPNAGQCANPFNQTITVNAPINPTFSAVGPYCQGAQAAALPNTSTNGIAGTWSPANISTANAGNVQYTFTPNAGQCANPFNQTIVVNAPINPTFSAVGPYCQGAQAAALPNTSTNGITGTWSPANISTAIAGNTQYTFTPNAGQCANPFNQSVVVNAIVIPNFPVFGPYCPTAQLPLLPDSSQNGIDGSWNPAIISTTLGPSTYTFTPIAGQCSDTASITITISNAVLPAFNGIGPYCQNTPGVPLPPVSDNGISGSWLPPSVNTNIAGSGQYIFAPDAGQCGDTVVIQIQVTAAAIPVFPSLGPYCIGDVATLPNPSLNGINGTWSPASINTAQPGMANYTFTPNPGSCSGDTTLEITVLNPIIFAGNDTTICAGSSIFLSASGGSNYVWNNGVQNGIPFTPNGSGSYVVCGSVGNCNDCDTLNVTVNPAPSASFLSEVSGNDVQFLYMGTPVTSFSWDFGDGGSSVLMDPNHTYPGPGIYGVLLTVTHQGCTSTYFAEIELIAPGSEAHLINVITPNGDGINDMFDLALEGYKEVTISIVNRWGNTMVELTGNSLTWDGTVEGKPALEGVYFYQFKALGFDGNSSQGQGFFHLKQ